jgi:hypothetical protein
LDDLNWQITTWLQDGHELIIAGDINKELGGDVTGFARISSKHDLVEIMQQMHGIDGGQK